MSNQLTITEASQLIDQEAIIEQGLKTFYEVGNALGEIRDARLYRQTHKTFEDYCQERWGMVASRARQLILASNVVDNLESVTIVTPVNNGELVLPTTESQTRPLTQLPPQQQAEVWQQAVNASVNGKPTAKDVRAAVDEHKAPKPYSPQHSTAAGKPASPEPKKKRTGLIKIDKGGGVEEYYFEPDPDEKDIKLTTEIKLKQWSEAENVFGRNPEQTLLQWEANRLLTCLNSDEIAEIITLLEQTK